jgi:hypothetical protein
LTEEYDEDLDFVGDLLDRNDIRDEAKTGLNDPHPNMRKSGLLNTVIKNDDQIYSLCTF